jgi:hypothetical protein
MEWATVSEEVIGLLKSFAGLFAQANRRDEVKLPTGEDVKPKLDFPRSVAFVNWATSL